MEYKQEDKVVYQIQIARTRHVTLRREHQPPLHLTKAASKEDILDTTRHYNVSTRQPHGIDRSRPIRVKKPNQPLLHTPPWKACRSHKLHLNAAQDLFIPRPGFVLPTREMNTRGSQNSAAASHTLSIRERSDAIKVSQNFSDEKANVNATDVRLRRKSRVITYQ